MPAAGEGRANYRMELATGLGPDGAMVDGQVMVNIIGVNAETGRGGRTERGGWMQEKWGRAGRYGRGVVETGVHVYTRARPHSVSGHCAATFHSLAKNAHTHAHTP